MNNADQNKFVEDAKKELTAKALLKPAFSGKVGERCEKVDEIRPKCNNTTLCCSVVIDYPNTGFQYESCQQITTESQYISTGPATVKFDATYQTTLIPGPTTIKPTKCIETEGPGAAARLFISTISLAVITATYM